MSIANELFLLVPLVIVEVVISVIAIYKVVAHPVENPNMQKFLLGFAAIVGVLLLFNSITLVAHIVRTMN